MIAVIADDITGAAEMAGIARRLGLRVCMSLKPERADDCDVLVIATDTRSMDAADAAAESRKVALALRGIQGVDQIFKKTDSALRGHVVAELEALLETTEYHRALYIPANPSKGRAISKGVYYVNGTPLHDTDFSFDPEFPAFSSAMAERFPDCAAKGIEWADAVTEEDIRKAVADASTDTLLAGAADLFTEFLRNTVESSETLSEKTLIDFSDCIIVRGSTQSRAIDCGVEVADMPVGVYDGEQSPDAWIDEVIHRYGETHAVILAVPHRHRTGKEIAVFLRETMAQTVEGLMAVHRPNDLVIEGGATAYAILARLGWDKFIITAEIAPGVIRMQASNGTYVTMKPGSYPWGGLF